MASSHPIDDDENIKYIGKYVCIGGTCGEIQYFGKIPGSNNFYFGLKLEEAVGNNDGMINNIRFFDCKDNYGIFIPFEKFVYSEIFEGFVLSSEAEIDNDLFLAEKTYFQEYLRSSKIECNVCTETSSGNILPDLQMNSVQESALNESHIVSEKQESSILEETIEFHDFEDDEVFGNESLFSECKAGEQLVEQASLYIKEQEDVTDLKGNYGCSASLEKFPNELYKSPWDSTGVADLNATLILSGKNELNKHGALVAEADKIESLKLTASILQDSDEMDNSSDSLEILPHLLDDNSPWDSLIFDPSTANLNTTVILSNKNELNQSVTAATEVDANELPISTTSIWSTISLNSRNNKSPVSHVKSSLKYTSTPRLENKCADIMNDDLQFYGFEVNETSPKGVKNKKSFESMLNEKNAKNLSPITANTSVSYKKRMLNVTCNIFEPYEFCSIQDSNEPVANLNDIQTLPDEKNILDLNNTCETNIIDDGVLSKSDNSQLIQDIGFEDFHSEETEFSHKQDNLNRTCDIQKLLNVNFAKSSDLKRNLENETGSLINTLNITYTEDLKTEFEALTLNEPEKPKELSLKNAEPNETALLNITYEKIDESSKLDTDSETSQVNFKNKLKNTSSLPTNHPVPLERKASVRKSRVFSKRKNETSILKHSDKNTDKYDVKENINSNTFKKNENLIEHNIDISEHLLNTNSLLTKNKNEALTIQNSEKIMSDKYNIRGNVSDNLLSTQSLQPKDSNGGASFTKSNMQDCQEPSLNKTVNLSLFTTDKSFLAKSEIPLKEKSASETKSTILGQDDKKSSLKITTAMTQSSIKRFSYSSQKTNLSDVMKLKEKHFTRVPEKQKLPLKNAPSRIPSSGIHIAPKERSFIRTKSSNISCKNNLDQTIIISDAQHHDARKSEDVNTPEAAASSQIPVRRQIPVFLHGNRKQVARKFSGPKNTDPTTQKLKNSTKKNMR